MEQTSTSAAKCSTTVLCFLIIVFGQGWLLWHSPGATFAAFPAALLGELGFCILMLAAAGWCLFRPKGWYNNLGCGIAFGLFIAYLIFNVCFYNTFATLYLSAITTQFQSWGKALVAMKLVLAIMGVIAGIPAAPAPSGREYAEKLRQAVYRQDAQWAKGNAKGAKQDFESAMAKLKENLSKEEMEALLAELRAETADAPAQTEGDKDESLVETWRGWGGGS